MRERKERFADSVEQVEQYTKDALNCQLRVYAFFIGTTDPITGDSWCPDCRTAEPIVEEATKKMSEKDLFIMCEVGDRDHWKTATNPFRTHPVFKLTEIPTLLSFYLDVGEIAVRSRLVNDGCKDPDLVDKFFSEG
ncbi:hypothetical protein CRM22_009946 [Opisthorchis felineus]|uniref:Thioredoxin domain-containing protein 17 n=1 Tax=Opisthorchis felineus TaxID=147828 RepID=A0A4S2L3I7_OPIFE|nr:hypothetical protein CRM22_009946 [Opisthorchis felineus]